MYAHNEKWSYMVPVIFILDKNRDILSLIQRQLKSYGFTKIYSFTHPYQAIREMSRSVIPDLIITAYFLPVYNGIEFLNRIRDYYPEVNGIIYAASPEEFPGNCPYPATILDVNNFEELFIMVKLLFSERG